MARGIKHIRAGLLNIEVIGTIPEHEPGRRRGGRCRPTCPAMQFYNDKRSWREVELWLAANFGGHDRLYTLTYDDAHLPPDKRAAGTCYQKFIAKLRAVRRRRKEELRYLYVTEGWHGSAANRHFAGDGLLEDRRLHHHVVLNSIGPGDFEEIRSLWGSVGGGYIRAEPVDVHYYRELAKYLTKEAREFGRAKPGERTWNKSRNLKAYDVEYIEIPSDSVTLSPPPGAVDYVQFTERNPFGFADCVGARYLLFEEEHPPEYSYTLGRRKKQDASNNFSA